jgi:stage II sporulation protein D
VATLAVAMGIEASCRSVPRRRVSPVPPTAPLVPTVESLVPAPILRVGILTEVPRVSLGADSGVVAWGVRTGAPPTLERVTVARATLLPLAAGTASTRYRVQVASLREEAAARTLSERVRETSGLVPAVRWNDETGTYQVRVGEFATREEAQSLAGRIGRTGLVATWVAEESQAVTGGRLQLLETGGEWGTATVAPAVPSEPMNVDGVPYRGVFEVRTNESGTLTVVNVVHLEDYLRGVVPNELSPKIYPRIEALKAQAVAARTYALRNRGQFTARGYDVCATAACQVYRGLSTEHPLSDQAVAETRGLVATHRGTLINALYTSTCGGHTEDGHAIFEGESAPYLRGVACAPERSAWGTVGTTASPRPLGSEPGLNRDAALLAAIGVLDARLMTEPALKAPATEADVREWTTRLVAALRRKGCDVRVEPPLARRGGFFSLLVGSLCWEERGRRLLGPQDLDYLLQVGDRAELAGERERLAAALLIHEGVLTPFPDNTLRPAAVITRAQALGVLARAALRAGVPGLVTAEFRGFDGGAMTVRRGESEETHPIERTVRLFRSLDRIPAATSELALTPGDAVNFILRDGRIAFLEADQTRLGAASDRRSGYYRWEVRLTPDELARSLSRYGSVGEVLDLIPQRIGVSGRVVELLVRGTTGQLTLHGLKIRWAFGLRENLFVIDRERAADGRVERFVFTGKGWGHGVGLCQVGADGMAQAGATHQQILKHYYQGVVVDRVY